MSDQTPARKPRLDDIIANIEREKKIQDALAAAQRALEANDFVQAQSLFEAVLRDDPGNAQAEAGQKKTLFSLGCRALEQGNYLNAQSFFSDLLKIDEHNAEARARLNEAIRLENACDRRSRLRWIGAVSATVIVVAVAIFLLSPTVVRTWKSVVATVSAITAPTATPTATLTPTSTPTFTQRPLVRRPDQYSTPTPTNTPTPTLTPTPVPLQGRVRYAFAQTFQSATGTTEGPRLPQDQIVYLCAFANNRYQISADYCHRSEQKLGWIPKGSVELVVSFPQNLLHQTPEHFGDAT